MFLILLIFSFFINQISFSQEARKNPFAALPIDMRNEVFKHVCDMKKIFHMKNTDDVDKAILELNNLYNVSLVAKFFENEVGRITNTLVPLLEHSPKSYFLYVKKSIIFSKIKNTFLNDFNICNDDEGDALILRISSKNSKHIKYAEIQSLNLLLKYNLCTFDDNVLAIYKKFFSGDSSLPASSRLKIACDINNPLLITLLLRNKEDPNEQDKDGNTIFMNYLKKHTKKREIIAKFLKHGADANIKNKSRETALSIAYKNWTDDIWNKKKKHILSLIAQNASQKNRRTNLFTFKNLSRTIFYDHPIALGCLLGAVGEELIMSFCG